MPYGFETQAHILNKQTNTLNLNYAELYMNFLYFYSVTKAELLNCQTKEREFAIVMVKTIK